MDLNEQIENIKTRADSLHFLNELRKDLQTNQLSWENGTLNSFLAAMSAWVEDSDGYYKNRGQQPPKNINWKVIADILMGGKTYE